MSLALRLFFWWTPTPPPPPPLPDPQEETDEIFYASDAFGDDAIGELVMCEAPIAGTRADPLPGADHWIFLNGIRSIGVKIASVSANRDLGQRGTMRFTMARTPDTPFTIPQVGWKAQLSWHDHLQWAGVIENVRIVNRAGTHDTVLEIQVDCASWERIAERRVTKETYANQTTRDIFNAVLNNILRAEGVEAGVIDSGLTLSLVGPRQDGDYIRVSELLRDVAEASGGLYDIDPFRRLNFRKDSLGAGALVMGNLVALHQAESSIERQDYRNVQLIRVKGNGGQGVQDYTYVHLNDAEIHARQSFEGGTGRYEWFEQIDHPFSDDAGEVQRLAVAAAVVKLKTHGRHARSLRGTLNFPRYRLGDVVVAHFPEHNAAGNWQLVGVRYRATQDRFFADYELVQTSVLQRGWQGWLKITGAGKAIVTVPGLSLFSNHQRFMVSGTFTVPDVNGDGSPINVSIEVYAAGGGGGGSNQITSLCNNQPFTSNGGHGGPGGKAVSTLEFPVGTQLQVVIGSGGAAGSGGKWEVALAVNACGPVATDGQPGGHSYVTHLGTVIVQANGGGGGPHALGQNDFVGQGAPGEGQLGQFTETGAGATAGQGGLNGGPGAAGANGYVDIRF